MNESSSRLRWIASTFSQRSVLIAILGYALAIVIANLLGANGLPFDRPLFRTLPLTFQLLIQPAVVWPLYLLLFMGMIYLVTRRREVPDMASKAPAKDVARSELLGLIAYGVIVLALGQVIGKAVGNHGIGLHLHGALFGATEEVQTVDVYLWSAYNFVFYALIPYVYFRRKGYSREQLNLTSSNPRNDFLLIIVALVIGLGLDFATTAGDLTNQTSRQLMIGIPFSFVIHMLGTGLPVMVFIYCLLFPRYMKLTGSIATTTILGGLTYAAVHIFEYWTVYDGLENSVLSVIFIFIQFFVPGMIKSFFTIRTGNAWVHLWAYHAISPHVLSGDTANIINIFRIR